MIIPVRPPPRRGPTEKARGEREGTVDQRHHGADILAEIGQNKGGIRQDAGSSPATWSACRARSIAWPAFSGSSAQPSLKSRIWHIAARDNAGPQYRSIAIACWSNSKAWRSRSFVIG